MNILVTGGEGFIGKKLVNKLEKEGHNVISLDKTESADIVADLSSENFFFEAIDWDIDYIFHLAAQSGGYYSLKDPYIDGKWNCLGTINVVKLAQKLKVKKLIYVSSMAVYGNERLASKITKPNPISFYGVSKLTGELYTKLIYEHSNIPYTIFRLFATYGSGQDLENKHQGILSIYLDQALNKDTIEITGSKDRVRELVHVDDVIEALMLSFNSKTNNEIYNVSNPEHLTPEIIISKISQALNKPLNIKEIDGYKGDQTYITSKTYSLQNLGWLPKINIKEGIKEFINNL
jgi:UDP-glucose 4-epimerase